MMAYPLSLRTLFLAVSIALLGLVSWELYCRSEGLKAAPESNEHIWAEQRAKVRDNDPEQILIIGSSRAWFDLQLDEWEDVQGIRPVMLADGGSSPGPTLQDLVENTNFQGTIIMDVTPGLFFGPAADSSGGWRRNMKNVVHFYERTNAERLNHFLSKPLQKEFAFLTKGQRGDPDLKSLVKRFRIGERVERNGPWPRIMYIDSDRNVTTVERLITDTAWTAITQRRWTRNPPRNRYPHLKDQIFTFYLDLIERFQERGGQIILVRNPSSADIRERERQTHPRAEYYDAFVARCNCPAYHFEDYEIMDRYFAPEWSHLATPDARIYTRDFVRLLIDDGVLERK